MIVLSHFLKKYRKRERGTLFYFELLRDQLMDEMPMQVKPSAEGGLAQ